MDHPGRHLFQVATSCAIVNHSCYQNSQCSKNHFFPEWAFQIKLSPTMDPSSQLLSLNSSVRTMVSTIPLLHSAIQVQTEKQIALHRLLNKLYRKRRRCAADFEQISLTLQNNTTLSNWEITSRTDFW